MNITASSKELLTIFVPHSCAAGVKSAINAITSMAGGVTVTATWGEWVTGDGLNIGEDVYKYEWLVDNSINYHGVVVDLAELMLGLGEQCVLVTFTGRHGINSVMYSQG